VQQFSSAARLERTNQNINGQEEWNLKKAMLTAMLMLVMLATVTSGRGTPSPVHATGAESGEDIRITLFGEPFSAERSPLLVDGVTLVPLRDIAEALGAEVSWDDGAKSVKLQKGASEIRITVGSADAAKNGEPLRLEAVPRLIGGVTMVPLRFIGESFDALITWNGGTRTVAIDRLQSLPAVGSYENLKTLLDNARQPMYGVAVRAGAVAGAEGMTSVTVQDQAGSAAFNAKTESPQAPASSTMKMKGEAAADYSATNTQVEGVDESDVIKTDGAYLYQVNKDRVVITQAVPATEMKVASVIGFEGQSFRPNELYVDAKYLVVIGSTSRGADGTGPVPMSGASDSLTKKMIVPIRPMLTTVKAIVYDIADKSAPKMLREVELDGDYVSSRKIGAALYLIANKNAGYAYAAKSGDGTPADEAKSNAPAYRDSAVSGESLPLDYKDIRYFPDSRETSYMLVGGINLDRADQPMDVSAYLGSGQNVFASEGNLYAAVTKYEPVRAEPAAAPQADTGAPATPGADALKSKIAAPSYETKTVVYKFRLEQGKTKFVTQGDVPGTILNQFSMDEHNGLFRIATTKGDMWRTDENTSKNNLYTLDEALKPLGKLEGIAPGERIYSVRFMGNRAYMVTFKNTDPLFAIDLTNPAAPTVLGALKIPGYSDYLHPYDENHLIGFGKETVEIPVKGDTADPTRTIAYYQGMKISLFDVTDVANPVEKFKEMIGDRGTESELLRNHKALLFSKERNLLAFPVTVMEIPNKGSANSATAYGQFSFQGAYVYGLDLTNGFQLKATLTHMTAEDRQKAGGSWYNSDRNVERILYIGDALYTLSKGLIRANDLSTLQEKGSLAIPQK
jgi:uncharacterized secreted protein with C-terminal beta-propeller domain